MNKELAIKYTTQGDFACSYCGYAIPVNSKNELRDWISADVAGMFCSKSHAIAAGNNLSYVAKFSHERVSA
jgi:hypothetical protein